jgi:hypothetical protein
MGPGPGLRPKRRGVLHTERRSECRHDLEQSAFVSARTARPPPESNLLLECLPLCRALAHEFGRRQSEPEDHSVSSSSSSAP